MILSVLKRFDYLLLLPMLLLLAFGLMVILSLDRGAFERQLVFALSGLLLYFALSLIDYRAIKRATVGYYVGIISLLLLLVFAGTALRGSTRWLELSFGQFQPSEFAKLALILLLAFFFEARVRSGISGKDFAVSFLLTLVPTILVYEQPDLGTALILLLIWGGLSLSAGLKWRYVLALLFSGLVLVLPLWSFLRSYQRQRFLYFLNPGSDPLGGGYNVLQSIIAVGSGMIWGRGFGRGTQSHLNFLPEHTTDFIFAALAEEWGFVGSLLLFLLFALLLIMVLRVGLRSADDFGFFLCVGVFLVLCSQFFINIGMNIGIMPVTGIPLPFVSYGGSSLWTTLLGLGLVQSVAIRRQKE